jgi:hypothetical protein
LNLFGIWAFCIFLFKERRYGYGMELFCYCFFFVGVVGKRNIKCKRDTVKHEHEDSIECSVDARVGSGMGMSNYSHDQMKMNFMIKPSLFQT